MSRTEEIYLKRKDLNKINQNKETVNGQVVDFEKCVYVADWHENWVDANKWCDQAIQPKCSSPYLGFTHSFTDSCSSIITCTKSYLKHFVNLFRSVMDALLPFIPAVKVKN